MPQVSDQCRRSLFLGVFPSARYPPCVRPQCLSSGEGRVGHEFAGAVGLHDADGHFSRRLRMVDADGEGLRWVARLLRVQHRDIPVMPLPRGDHLAVDKQLDVPRRRRLNRDGMPAPVELKTVAAGYEAPPEPVTPCTSSCTNRKPRQSRRGTCANA